MRKSENRAIHSIFLIKKCRMYCAFFTFSHHFCDSYNDFNTFSRFSPFSLSPPAWLLLAPGPHQGPSQGTRALAGPWTPPGPTRSQAGARQEEKAKKAKNAKKSIKIIVTVTKKMRKSEKTHNIFDIFMTKY